MKLSPFKQRPSTRSVNGEILNPKMLGFALLSAIVLMSSVAASASATTLEVEGVTKNETVAVTMSYLSGSSAVTSRTDGSLANTCTSSHVGGHTATFTGTTVTVPLSVLSFNSCERAFTVHKAGTLHVEHIAGTTNGTVSSSGTEVTVGSPFGTLNCKTGTGVDFGTLTGTASGHAEIDINAVMNCGFLVPSSTWKGTYVVTSPTGFGVSA